MTRLTRPLGASVAAAALVLLVALRPVPVAAGPYLLGVIDVPPIGVADAYTTAAQTTLVVGAPGVLANDTDLDSTQLTAHLVSGPTHGNLTLDATGGFRYQPDGGFSGIDTFTYKPFDGTLEALLPATVAITVAPGTSTPAPTPKPTPTPSPTPTPTPTPTPPPLPIPTPMPTVGLPGGSSPPTPAASPASSPIVSSGPSNWPAGSTPPGAGLGGGPVVTTGGGSTPGGPDLTPTIPVLEPRPGLDSLGAFGALGIGIEWMVPTLVFTIPGFLVILIGLAQVFGGFIWLPLVRRWLRGDGRSSRVRPGIRGPA